MRASDFFRVFIVNGIGIKLGDTNDATVSVTHKVGSHPAVHSR
jgi:hypothetical protein